MISRRTEGLIWGSLLLPISLLIAIKTFEFPFSRLLHGAVHYGEKQFWNALVLISFVLGSLCVLLLPFSVILDSTGGRKKIG